MQYASIAVFLIQTYLSSSLLHIYVQIFSENCEIPHVIVIDFLIGKSEQHH